MFGEKYINTWERERYIVKEKPFDFDLSQFDIIQDGRAIETITVFYKDDQESIRNALNNGKEIDGWNNGFGDVVYIK